MDHSGLLLHASERREVRVMRRGGFLSFVAGVLFGLREAPPAGRLNHWTTGLTEAELGQAMRSSPCVLPSSIVSGGGLCAPLTPYYDIPGPSWGFPLKDALPSFTAERGGVAEKDDWIRLRKED